VISIFSKIIIVYEFPSEMVRFPPEYPFGKGINFCSAVEGLKKASEYSGFSKFVENPHLFEGYT
jgi:hypothetical protein